MRRQSCFFALVCLLLCAGPAAPNAPAQAPAGEVWQSYTYPGEEFSVELPEMPFAFRDTRIVSTEPLEYEQVHVFGLHSGRAAFKITSLNKPRPFETFEQIAGTYLDRQDISSAKEVRVHGVPALEFRTSGTLSSITRILFGKRHAYIVAAYARREDHPSLARFMNSFTIGPRRRGVEIVRSSLPSGVTSAQVFKQGEVDAKAVVLHKPAPGFTEQARKNNVSGITRLRAVLDVDGKVRNISVIKPLPEGLTEKAIAAARYILFLPAEKDGRPVPQYIVLEYNFNIY